SPATSEASAGTGLGLPGRQGAYAPCLHCHLAKTAKLAGPRRVQAGERIISPREICMKAETFDYLLEWTSDLHTIIADRLEQAITADTDQRSRWLMEYVAGHERDIASKVDRFRAQAGEAE